MHFLSRKGLAVRLPEERIEQDRPQRHLPGAG
jgi:hypothetical protein